MNQKAMKTLEFDKILTRLASYTQNERVRARCLALEPETELERARALQRETTEAVGLVMRQGNPPGMTVFDLAPSLARLARGGILSIRELLATANLLKVGRQVKSHIASDQEAENGTLGGLAASIAILREVEVRIDEAVASEDELADGASPELAAIRRRMKQTEGKIRDTLSGIISSPHYQKFLQDPIISMRGDRFVVPVKSEHKNDLKGIVHDTSASGSTLFVEPMAVVTLANELATLAGQEKDEVERILAELSAFVSEYADALRATLDAVYELDFIFCKAKLSVDQNAMEPALNDAGVTDIRQGRHPLLDPAKVVPIDIELGERFDTLVITGPNTGGKTVSLKTLGLFSLMAQSGLHLPVKDNSRIAVFERVFADIGDEQSIEQSLSTFSSHMVNLVSILRSVNDRSLVLMDELGAGTDPVEGASLAIAILESIRDRGGRAAATTHYSELKTYALTTDGVENASCEFDVETLSPTYRLLIGIPGKSNAFAISRRLGLEESVIRRARELLHDDDVKMEDVLAQLEENKREAERERRRAETLQRDAALLKKRLESEIADAEERRRAILDDARRESLRILDEAKEDAQRAVRDIRAVRDAALALDAEREAERSKSQIKAHEDKILSAMKRKPVSNRRAPKTLAVGSVVEALSIGQRATVLTKPTKDGAFQAQAGLMKINLNLRDVQLVEEKPAYEKPKTAAPSPSRRSPSGGGSGPARSSATELDLRGRYAQEALDEVDKFLDRAVLSGLTSVTLIHGKGTGTLRRSVRDYLKGHSHVAEYRPGRYGEGEDGVTVVTLK